MSAQVPVPFLWILDFGFETLDLDFGLLDLGLDLGLTIRALFKYWSNKVQHIIQLKIEISLDDKEVQLKIIEYLKS